MTNQLTETGLSALAQQDDRTAAIQAVLDGLQSPHTRRAYSRHLTDFLAWHEAQGRPVLAKAVVQAYKARFSQVGPRRGGGLRPV